MTDEIQTAEADTAIGKFKLTGTNLNNVATFACLVLVCLIAWVLYAHAGDAKEGAKAVAAMGKQFLDTGLGMVGGVLDALKQGLLSLFDWIQSMIVPLLPNDARVGKAMGAGQATFGGAAAFAGAKNSSGRSRAFSGFFIIAAYALA